MPAPASSSLFFFLAMASSIMTVPARTRLLSSGVTAIILRVPSFMMCTSHVLVATSSHFFVELPIDRVNEEIPFQKS